MDISIWVASTDKVELMGTCTGNVRMHSNRDDTCVAWLFRVEAIDFVFGCVFVPITVCRMFVEVVLYPSSMGGSKLSVRGRALPDV